MLKKKKIRKEDYFFLPSSYTAFKATMTAAGATNVAMLRTIGEINAPITGRFSNPAAPATSSAIVASKKLYTSFLVMFRNPTIIPSTTKIIANVPLVVPNNPASIASTTPAMKDHLPILSISFIGTPLK